MNVARPTIAPWAKRGLRADGSEGMRRPHRFPFDEMMMNSADSQTRHLARFDGMMRVPFGSVHVLAPRGAQSAPRVGSGTRRVHLGVTQV
jgi:hypothetical protein